MMMDWVGFEQASFHLSYLDEKMKILTEVVGSTPTRSISFYSGNTVLN
jgi:hypothetical protein